jgi:hypothetical protein
MKIRFHAELKAAATFMAAAGALWCGSLSAQPILTGIGVFGCDSTGAADNSGEWNTVPGDRFVDVFLAAGSTLNGAFINGATDAQAAINIPLSPGQYTYRLFGGSGYQDAYHAISLCFNGNATPGISAFGATQYSPSAPPPGFQANRNASAYDLNMNAGPGANSLSFQQGNTLVTLAAYSWADPSCYNVDRISAPFGNYGSIGQDGVPDWVGLITLNVTSVPEPGTGALAVLGAAGWALGRRRKRKNMSDMSAHE